jgi:4-aminobutyrate aminotransferase-like enzyme
LNDIDLPLISSATVPGPKSLEWAERLRSVESPDTTNLSSDFPVFWNRGQGCLVYDDDDNRYLDLTSSFGVLGVGHSHPSVVDAINRQAGKLIHGMGDVHPSTLKVELLEKIAGFSPIKDPLIVLGLNGSDAVEAAFKTAYLATGKPGVLAFEGGYHGLTYGALEATHRDFFRRPFASQRGNFARHLPFGCNVDSIEAALENNAIPVGAVIVEPIQGRAGIQIPPAGWLAGVRQACTKAGALLIADEIFTGWGRTGTCFACEGEKIIPDILCIGKGMGGGMPISACVGSREIMQSAWSKSQGEARHTYTFLGHPLSCAAALATIDVIERDGLVERSRELGASLLSSLEAFAIRYPNIVRSARGRGLMIGLELADPSTAWKLVLSALSSGIILLSAGERGDVVEIVPPLTISDRQASWSIDTLGRLLSDLDKTA